jgi:hypothetical protein
LRIFFWSNFLGRPWTVVKVLRPLRSAWMRQCAVAKSNVAFKGMTYAGYGCGCSSETAFQCRRLHPLRRTGLECLVSLLFLRLVNMPQIRLHGCPSLDTAIRPPCRQRLDTGWRMRGTESQGVQEERVWQRRVVEACESAEGTYRKT